MQKINMNISDYIQEKARVDTPMGPVIFGMQVPEQIFQNCLDLAENIWNRKDHISWNHQLAGHISNQYYVPHTQMKEYGIYDFIMECLKHYILSGSTSALENKYDLNELQIDLEAFWVNFTYAGEHNPIHNHGQATISGTIHLMEPEYHRPPTRKSENDGNLSIVYGSPICYDFDRYSMNIKTVPRGMYMWPAQLLHGVSPFMGEGLRVSMAFNAVHYHKNNPENRHKATDYQ